ncbi:MAG: glycosyltransferase [Actinomycetota bacterium]|nr:glycosyltransferase [Actinomycetota bacterium]
MRIAFVSTYPPRRCGIATFTSDLISAVRTSGDRSQCRVAAIDERSIVRAYGNEVRWRIRQGSADAYVAAARAINDSTAEIVCVQHEFGLYGRWKGESWVGDTWIEGTYEDHLTPFLEELHKPSLVTLHTVLPEPSPAVRAAVGSIADATHGLVVMAETAVDILSDVYGVTLRPTVIPHGMPHIEPKGRRRLKAKLGLDGRMIISTFGLVSPGKGLEYAIEAMPAIVEKHPQVQYLIAGQTHPELLRKQGEQYRNKLIQLVEDAGLSEHVAFVNQYLEQKDVIDYLLATDVYVTPYLDPNQITSGTLSYALGAGKAVVSTPYLHAKEALAEERGLLVDFRSPDGIAEAVNSILDDADLKHRLEHNAYEYAKKATWPRTGERFVETMRELVAAAPDSHPDRRRSRMRPVSIGERLPENPLITPADIAPSQPGFEVISTINPGVARFGKEIVLLVRVAERPRLDATPTDGAAMIDLTGPEARLVPLPPGLPPDRLIGMAFFDVDQHPARIVLGFVPRDLPGLDLSDPRTIRYRPTAGGFAPGNDEFTDYLSHISHLRVARSADGISFEIDATPTIGPGSRLEEYGVEDPRITEIDGVFHITYVSVSRLGIATSRLTTKDFRSFERHGVMMHPDQKDVVLFPERVNGRYVALTRPMPGSFGRVLGIWLAESDDLVQWGHHRPIALPRSGGWDEMRIGASCVPIRVPDGWLELYHGADRMNRYGLGALLLDADDPSHVLARSNRPILVPQAQYEHDGFLHDVVFATGHIVLDDGRIRVYYGAADTALAAVEFAIDDILSNLDPC